MAGLLTHLIISLTGFLILFLIFKNFKAGLIFAFAHLLPDLISFGIPAIRYGKLHPKYLIITDMYYPLKTLTHSFSNWAIICLLIFVFIVILYKIGKIKKTKFYKYTFYIISFLTGIIIHLIADILINEKNRWI